MQWSTSFLSTARALPPGNKNTARHINPQASRLIDISVSRLLRTTVRWFFRRTGVLGFRIGGRFFIFRSGLIRRRFRRRRIGERQHHRLALGQKRDRFVGKVANTFGIARWLQFVVFKQEPAGALVEAQGRTLNLLATLNRLPMQRTNKREHRQLGRLRQQQPLMLDRGGRGPL